jgi:hypothetical protein
MSNSTSYEIRYNSELSGQKALYGTYGSVIDAYAAKREFYANCLKNNCDRVAASIEVNEVRVRY